MTWLRLDDDFATNPKIFTLSDGAFRGYVMGLCYASRHLSDGFVPKGWVTDRAAAELEAAGLWIRDGAGWQIHDYLEYNRSRADAEQERSRKQAAGAAGGRAAAAARADRSAVAPATPRASGASDSTGQPPVPIPTPPKSKTRAMRASALSLPDLFEEFWDAFEYKVDRAKAEQAWTAAIQRGAIPGEIISGALAYAKWWTGHPDPPTHKYAQGWLNDSRWNDVLPSFPSRNGRHEETTAERFERLGLT